MPLKVITTRTIAIVAGKGGVGKSSFTVLLAGALKRRGERVGIIDADLYGPSLRQMLPEQRLPQQVEGRLVPAMAQGIQTMSLAYFHSEAAVRAPVANQLLSQFLHKVAWQDVSHILIDFPPGTGDIPLSTAQAVALSGAVVVTTPQKVALLDVRKTIGVFKKMRVPILGIVENMSGGIFGSGGGVALSEEFGIPFLGTIPLDEEITRAADNGTLLELKHADAMVERLEKMESEPIQDITLFEGRLAYNGHLLEAKNVQQKCPCAQCKEGKIVANSVVFSHFERVGRYGLRFNFSSGCSYGIYDFILLDRLICENS